jgi:predicted trehalose synthase
MKNRSLIALVSVGLSFAVACAAMQQQKAAPAHAQGQFKNLQVLPPNISHDDLIATMRGFNRGLGVRCDFCHAAAAGSEKELDFASDAKPEKGAARVMLRMTERINTDYLPKLGAHADPVACWTCHRGHHHPEEEPAAPPPGEHAH